MVGAAQCVQGLAMAFKLPAFTNETYGEISYTSHSKKKMPLGCKRSLAVFDLWKLKASITNISVSMCMNMWPLTTQKYRIIEWLGFCG